MRVFFHPVSAFRWFYVAGKIFPSQPRYLSMEGFILAAGLGTRLKPLTDHRPKALVEVNGVTLLELAINKLQQSGVHRIVVNVHHFGQQVIDFLDSRTWEAEVVVSDERQLLMDTGGALKQAAPLFSGTEPIVVHNVDILSNLNLTAVLESHRAQKALATLCVSRRTTGRQLLFTPEGKLCGWRNRQMGDELWTDVPHPDATELAFSGISIVEPQLLDLLPPANHPYPVIPCYLEIAKTHIINAFEHPAEHWLDVGKPETLAQAEQWNDFCKK